MHQLLEFQERAVRDLAWVILSPPMIQTSSVHVRCATSQWCADQFEDFLEQLRALDRDPRPLLQALEKQASPKLGKYFENLIAYWLDASPNFDLLARNVQIRDAKITYGELDLIVHDRQTARTSHWEVAAKFYLELGPAAELRSWVGPNRRDDLGRKSQHLLDNQARRSEHPVARTLLADRSIDVQDAFVFLKGHLFHTTEHKQSGTQPAAADSLVQIHPEHERSWWCTRSEFERTHATSDLSWFELIKPNWLVNQSGFPASSAQQPWSPDHCTGPTLIVGLSGDLQVERGFVVPDDWGRTIES